MTRKRDFGWDFTEGWHMSSACCLHVICTSCGWRLQVIHTMCGRCVDNVRMTCRWQETTALHKAYWLPCYNFGGQQVRSLKQAPENQIDFGQRLSAQLISFRWLACKDIFNPKRKSKRKWKRSKNKQKRIKKNKRQTSRNFFALDFVFAKCELGLNLKGILTTIDLPITLSSPVSLTKAFWFASPTVAFPPWTTTFPKSP